MTKMQLSGLLLLLIGAIAPSALAEDALTPERLRCEYREAPLGVDITAPRLSWIVTSDKRGQRQTAYQIRVASSEKGLAQGTADLWDSGKVASDETVNIEYTGKALSSRTPCYWQVKVWDKDGNPSDWSDAALWSMGLLNKSDWSAE
ncbi:MAG: hypothetical protein L3K26_04015 [Candidatus Hydrogenedentes bacterium]|nr:hypothetical protein [Candidatus Hydrogenedentota bacterium]